MDIGEGFADIAPDLRKYVVEFAFGDIYARQDLIISSECYAPSRVW